MARRQPNVGLWVFGYGSLIWRPGMQYVVAHRATAYDWARRFWQGSHDHRGTVDAPGRVLTLVQLSGALCEGRVFGISNEHVEQTLTDLDYREKNGYQRQTLSVHAEGLGELDALTYIAPENNTAWLGHASNQAIAEQIYRSEGPSGSNKDYVLELHKALQNDSIHDAHVIDIASSVYALDGSNSQ